MSLRIDCLITFVTAVELGGFAKAAKKMGITEGSVSYHIASLEKYFGAMLFTRAIRGAKLTEEGKIAFETAKNILEQLEAVKRQLMEMAEAPRGTIKIEASTIPGEQMLPKLMSSFKERHQGVDFVVRISDSKTAFDKLVSGEVDLAAVGSLLSAPRRLEYERMPIGEEKLVLIVPVDHELASSKSVSVQEILSQPWVIREKGSGTRAETERILSEAGVDPSEMNVKLELGSTESVMTAVEEGVGVSVVSETAARKAEKAKLVKVLEISGVDDERMIYLVRDVKGEMSKPTKLFWAYSKTRSMS